MIILLGSDFTSDKLSSINCLILLIIYFLLSELISEACGDILPYFIILSFLQIDQPVFLYDWSIPIHILLILFHLLLFIENNLKFF